MNAVIVDLECIYVVPTVPDGGERAFHEDVGVMAAATVEAELAAAALRLTLETNRTAAAWLRSRIAALLRRQDELEGLTS